MFTLFHSLKNNYHRYKAEQRQKCYLAFLKDCAQHQKTVQDIIHLGHTLMRKAKLHPHFFGNNSLLENAQYLTFFALNLPYEYTNPVYLHKRLTVDNARTILDVFEKRISTRMPVEYISQEAWYCGHRFYVTPDVLIPRSIMSTRFKDFLEDIAWSNNRVLDLCSGSGCIGITLALLNPKIKVDLVDISEKALAVAKHNVDAYGLEDRINCIKSNLFENVHHQYDLIITNPPYVSTGEYNQSPAEFKHEPKLALEAGKDGLTLLNQIILQSKSFLTPSGKLIAEVGVTAAKRLKKRYPAVKFQWYKYRKPNGKQALLAMDCIFCCNKNVLP